MKKILTGNQRKINTQKNHLKSETFQVIVMTLLFLVLFTGSALAQSSIVLDHKPLALEVEPVVDNGRTLVPLRTILEPLGTSIIWDETTKTVKAQKGSKIVSLTIGDTKAYVDQTPVTLDVPSKIIDGRTMVPLRFVSESFGAKVQYDSISNTIFISSDPNAPGYISYTNKTYGISIMHPSDWEKAENELGLIVMFISPKLSNSINLASEDLPVPMSLDLYIKLSERQINNNFSDVAILDSYPTTMGNISAQTIVYTATVNNVNIKCMATAFIHNNKGYAITYGGKPEDFDSYLDEAKTIVSTFRFED